MDQQLGYSDELYMQLPTARTFYLDLVLSEQSITRCEPYFNYYDRMRLFVPQKQDLKDPENWERHTATPENLPMKIAEVIHHGVETDPMHQHIVISDHPLVHNIARVAPGIVAMKPMEWMMEMDRVGKPWNFMSIPTPKAMYVGPPIGWPYPVNQQNYKRIYEAVVTYGTTPGMVYASKNTGIVIGGFAAHKVYTDVGLQNYPITWLYRRNNDLMPKPGESTRPWGEVDN